MPFQTNFRYRCCSAGCWLFALLFGLGSHSVVAQYDLGPIGRKARPAAGRLHFLDGHSQDAKLLLIDHNQIQASGVETGKTIFTPLQVSSFVMGPDSFTVLKDYYVTVQEDPQHYNLSFMRVCAAGAGLEVYEFNGMAGTEIEARTSPGPGVTTVTTEHTAYALKKAWLLRRAGQPQWQTLPSGARNLQPLIQPIIADDPVLAAAVRWNQLDRRGAVELLRQYVANKTSKPQPGH